ncbi:hypothetical protein HMPREF1248_0285 [Coriobacteriaceae bacterium BV3Ac1]|nr:hypothetical protein HMPREF1248_0285 [Coriobacteriaceae bacterium BV3Ac1]
MSRWISKSSRTKHTYVCIPQGAQAEILSESFIVAGALVSQLRYSCCGHPVLRA